MDAFYLIWQQTSDRRLMTLRTFHTRNSDIWPLAIVFMQIRRIFLMKFRVNNTWCSRTKSHLLLEMLILLIESNVRDSRTTSTQLTHRTCQTFCAIFVSINRYLSLSFWTFLLVGACGWLCLNEWYIFYVRNLWLNYIRGVAISMMYAQNLSYMFVGTWR